MGTRKPPLVFEKFWKTPTVREPCIRVSSMRTTEMATSRGGRINEKDTWNAIRQRSERAPCSICIGRFGRKSAVR